MRLITKEKSTAASLFLTAAAGTLVALSAMMLSTPAAAASYDDDIVRLSRITVDAAQLEAYKAFLKEEAQASMRIEPGVRLLYAVSEKDNPTQFTIVEIYDNEESYKSHLKTPHFLKYKNGTIEMVKDLKLIDVVPLVPEMQIKPPVK